MRDEQARTVAGDQCPGGIWYALPVRSKTVIVTVTGPSTAPVGAGAASPRVAVSWIVPSEAWLAIIAHRGRLEENQSASSKLNGMPGMAAATCDRSAAVPWAFWLGVLTSAVIDSAVPVATPGRA